MTSTIVMQGLEGYVKVHAQITRGGLYCEHANVLRGTPVSFSDRVRRMRELADYIPGRVSALAGFIAQGMSWDVHSKMCFFTVTAYGERRHLWPI